MKLKVSKVSIEPHSDLHGYMLADIEGFNNKDVVKAIGAGELIAEMDIKDIVENVDISDFLDGVNNIQQIKDYLIMMGEETLT